MFHIFATKRSLVELFEMGYVHDQLCGSVTIFRIQYII